MQLAVDDLVLLCLAEPFTTAVAASADVQALIQSLIDTARGGGATEGLIIGLLQVAWAREDEGAPAHASAGSQCYLSVLRLLHRAWEMASP